MTERQELSELKLGGRVFRPASTMTFRRDLWIMAHIEAAKLGTLRAAEDDILTDFSQTLIVRAFESGRLFLMLAGILDEDGVTWTPERAEQVATFFAELTDTDEKLLLQSAIVGMLGSFFVSAVALRTTSLKSSSLEATAEQPVTVGATPPA